MDRLSTEGEDAMAMPVNPTKPAETRVFDDARRATKGRKPRACHGCKRLKMKCETNSGQKTCRRCHRKGLQCLLNPSASLISASAPDGYEYKIDEIYHTVQRMQQTMNVLIRRLDIQPSGLRQETTTPSKHDQHDQHDQPSDRRGIFPSATSVSPGDQGSTNEPLGHRQEISGMAMTREPSPASQENEDDAQGPVLVTEPMGSLYEVTRLRNIRSQQAETVRTPTDPEVPPEDFITRGVISKEEAQSLFQTFHTSLNHYLWVGLEQIHPNFDSVRRSSSLLTATILTVTALHIPTSATTFDTCYREFLSLVSSSMFSRYHSVDDVRALCIAAFWLSDVSWKLSGHAIRIATELNIHQSFFRALEGDREHFLRARLWYMLYVCDHHFSIAYGRPPVIAESYQIREHELFLKSPMADQLDLRILSQVALSQILTRVQDTFESRRHNPQDSSRALLSEDNFPQMRQFNVEIDQWRVLWHARQVDNPYIGSFPPKGIILYAYFAKLQLNSLAIRGVHVSRDTLPTERKEFINIAISAAASILTFVIDEEDMRRCLVGTPLYVHTMITVASVFLMKIITEWKSMGFNVNSDLVWNLLNRMVALLKGTIASERHLVYHIAAGLEKMMTKSKGYMSLSAAESSGDATNNVAITANANVDPNSRHAESFPRVDGHQGPSHWSDYGPTNLSDPIHGDIDFNEMMLNDDFIYEAFGLDIGDRMHNLLNTQF